MGERHWPLAGCCNLRDLGGYPTRDGGMTRWRTAYRADSLHALPLASQDLLVAAGVRTVIDLRSADEQAWEPSVFSAHPMVQYRPLPFYGSASPYEQPVAADLAALYARDVDQYGAEIAAILRSLLTPGTFPVAVHCALGKDRTGIITALLLGIAGVAPADIIADYALSAACLAGTLAAIRAQTPAEDLEAYGFSLDCTPAVMARLLAHWDLRYGGIPGYAQAIGLTAGQIADLRARLVCPPAPASDERC
ncbi:MAG TPA: tyrosine-protein phosphatase [Herpetosiphonaceae bacterium]|nr:tyrosine-protein phosphatase [Herpetosiphonaceae bacterium]